MRENELATIILDVAFEIHRQLGPGLLESVYQAAMIYELKTVRGISVEVEKPIEVIWKGVNLGLGFRADLIVENKVIVEFKSVDLLSSVHLKQVLTYLRVTGIKLGLLINFNEPLLKTGVKRVANNL